MTTAEIPAGHPFNRPDDQGGLGALGYKIFLDRYALKDMTKQSIAPGDTVVVVIDQKTGQREIGTVTARNDSTVVVELREGGSIQQAIEHVDKPLETHPSQMVARVARGIAEVESPEKRAEWRERFEWLLSDWRFLPGGRILAAAGTDQQLTFYNCYVIPSPKDSRTGIVETLSNMMEIMSRGGGVGINVSSLRPKHAYVKGVNGRSSGAVSWGGLYSFVTGLIEQGGSRRGALMLILDDWHPDLLEFINAKREAGKITNANISVGISDAFMKAIEEDADWPLVFPDTADPEYDALWNGDLAAWRAQGKPVMVHKTLKAREIWNQIIESAWASAEPGVWFRDRSNQMSNSYYYEQLVCTNPCGEQPLPAWGICNLGAIHLAKFVTPEREVLWEDLGRAVRYGIRFLDDVIDATPYFFEENARQQQSERRVGLGTMGLGEMLIRLGIRYGSAESERFIDHLYEFIAGEAYLASAEYAAEKGSFSRFEAEKLLQSGYMQRMPERVRAAVRKQGLRNVTLLTQAPTGCVAPTTIVSTGSGLQPIAELGDRDGETWQTIDLTVATDTGRESASHFYVNGVRPVKTVTTRHGFRLTATGNHRLRVIDGDGAYAWRRMDELESGDELVLKRNTIEGKPVALSDVPRTKPHLPPYPAVMTPDLALLLGLYMGDGYTKARGGLHLVLTGQDADLIDSVRTVLHRVFGSNTATVEQRQGCVVVNHADRALPRFFNANGFAKESGNHGEGAASAFIPAAVLRSGRACLTAFLRGLFEADGCVTRDTITLVSSSPHLIEQTQTALLSLGVVCAVRRMPASTDHRGARPLYELRPLNRAEAVRFVEQVGFLSARKSALARAIRVPTDGHRGDAVRNEALLREFYLASAGQPNALRQELLHRITNGSVTQAYLRTVLDRAPALRESRLARIIEMDVYLDPVADLTDSVCDTYDLSVPETNTYIANGFVSHNTTGTMMDTSTGIEPYFSWSYFRKGRLGLHEVAVPVVAEWKEQHPGEELPEYFVAAMDLTPEEHVRVEAAIQRWIDSSISKTANLPAEYTVEQTRELYELMYRLGCKGGTVYRDSSRDEQVLMLKKDEPPVALAGAVSNGVPSLNVTVSVTAEAAPLEEGRPKPSRVPLPDERRSITHKFIVGEQEGYITVGLYDDGAPGEVFLRVSKQGSTVSGLMESLGLLTSVALQYGVPLEGLARKMKNSRFEPYGMTGNREIPTATSLVDYVFRWLEKKFVLGEQLPLLTNGNGGSGHEQLSMALPAAQTEAGVLDKADVEYVPSGMGCPECGSLLHHAEGCLICRSCGYTKCG
jgi:adenosylcobalamin-dependent ribonucleoside-diphosphate reductase